MENVYSFPGNRFPAKSVSIHYFKSAIWSLSTILYIAYICLFTFTFNTHVEMKMMPNLSAKYELTFCVTFYLLNNFEVLTCYKN